MSNEVVHAVDVCSTLAGLGGATVPADRPIDGVDPTPFLLDRRDSSGSEGFLIYRAEELYAVNWRNRKFHYYWKERIDSAPEKLGSGLDLTRRIWRRKSTRTVSKCGSSFWIKTSMPSCLR